MKDKQRLYDKLDQLEKLTQGNKADLSRATEKVYRTTSTGCYHLSVNFVTDLLIWRLYIASLRCLQQLKPYSLHSVHAFTLNKARVKKTMLCFVNS